MGKLDPVAAQLFAEMKERTDEYCQLAVALVEVDLELSTKQLILQAAEDKILLENGGPPGSNVAQREAHVRTQTNGNRAEVFRVQMMRDAVAARVKCAEARLSCLRNQVRLVTGKRKNGMEE